MLRLLSKNVCYLPLYLRMSVILFSQVMVGHCSGVRGLSVREGEFLYVLFSCIIEISNWSSPFANQKGSRESSYLYTLVVSRSIVKRLAVIKCSPTMNQMLSRNISFIYTYVLSR